VAAEKAVRFGAALVDGRGPLCIRGNQQHIHRTIDLAQKARLAVVLSGILGTSSGTAIEDIVWAHTYADIARDTALLGDDLDHDTSTSLDI